MSEYITNGDFDSSLTGWTNTGGDLNWTWDASGAGHDGGSAKATHAGAINTTIRHRMSYSFTVSNSANIFTAVMNGWTQFNDAYVPADALVATCWIKFWFQLEDPDGNFYTVASSTNYFGSQTSNQLASDANIKSTLVNGGDGTWKMWVVCDIRRTNMSTAYCAWLVGWVDDLSIDITHAYNYTNTSTGTLGLSGTSTTAYAMGHSGTGTLSLVPTSAVSAGMVHSGTGTLSLSALSGASQSIRTDWAMFLGSSTGKVYDYNPDALSDDGVAVGAIWQSKQTDLADQVPEMADQWKNLWKVRLVYVDKTASTNVTVYVSVDGGESWSSRMKSLGTGDGTTKSADFYFILPFEFLDVKVEHASDANEFQWAGLYVYWTPAGEHFEI